MEWLTLKKLQHNRAKKLCFMVSKWLADWHCAKSMVDTVQFLFCHTLYIYQWHAMTSEAGHAVGMQKLVMQ